MNDRPKEQHEQQTSMTPLQLLERHVALVTKEPEAWYDLFADDAVVEFPFARGTTVPPKLIGKEAIRGYFAPTGTTFGPFTFSNLRAHASPDGRAAIGEVHGSSIALPTGAAYEQDYVMVITAERGRIVHYREYWNPLVAFEAFGLSPAPKEVAR